MENNKTIIEEVSTNKESEELDLSLACITGAAIAGGVVQLAKGSTYVVGIGAGLLFGKKAGLKTIGTIVGVGSLWTAARYATGEFSKKD